MAATTKFALKLLFEDDTTTTLTIDSINPSTVTSQLINSARQTIMNFNAQRGGTLASKMKSKNGFNWIAIKSFTITNTERTYIF